MLHTQSVSNTLERCAGQAPRKKHQDPCNYKHPSHLLHVKILPSCMMHGAVLPCQPIGAQQTVQILWRGELTVHDCGNTKILVTTNTPDSHMLHGHVPHASHNAWCCAALPAKGGSAEGSHLALLTKILATTDSLDS